MRGLRVFPRRLEPFFASPREAARALSRDAEAMGVDTLFVLAYDPVHGAHFPAAQWPDRIYGEFLPMLVDSGLNVVASFYLNRFDRYAEEHPESTMRDANGHHLPLISAYAPGFRTWLREVLELCASHVPGLAGFEAFEATVARMGCDREEAPDYHREATRLFRAKWPFEPMGGMKWRDFRSDGLTLLHRTLFEVGRSVGRTYVAHELPVVAACDTRLLPFSDYGRLTGFDLERVKSSGVEVVTLRTSWQRLEAGCGLGVFDPWWVSGAVSQLRAQGHERIAIDVDASGLDAEALSQTLRVAGQATDLVIVSDYAALKEENLLDSVRQAYLDPMSSNRVY